MAAILRAATSDGPSSASCLSLTELGRSPGTVRGAHSPCGHPFEQTQGSTLLERGHERRSAPAFLGTWSNKYRERPSNTSAEMPGTYGRVPWPRVLCWRRTTKPKSRRQSTERYQRWIAAENKKDVEAITDLYDENAVLMPKQEEPVIGKAAIGGTKKLVADPHFAPFTLTLQSNSFHAVGDYPALGLRPTSCSELLQHNRMPSTELYSVHARRSWLRLAKPTRSSSGTRTSMAGSARLAASPIETSHLRNGARTLEALPIGKLVQIVEAYWWPITHVHLKEDGGLCFVV